MLSVSIGGDINAQRFEAKLNGAATTLDAGLATTAGVPHHYAITFTDSAGAFGAAGGRWHWFRDGDAVAFLDVNYKLASIEDVNNWLGRSLWSGDNMANNDYAEVRISTVAMTRDEILANYTLGPNHIASSVTLTADDPIGTASFAAAANWSDSLAPSAGKNYETYRFRLRPPADGVSRSFAGQTLALTGGGITWKGTSSSSLTVNNLSFNGDCELIQAGSGTWTLAGNIAVRGDETLVRAANGPINLSASLSGTGSLLHVNNTVTMSGNNAAFTGKTKVGDGRFSGLSIDSEARLGANPATFTADQLTLNRGILYSGTMTIDDANRGIRIGVSAGLFSVSPGTTTTIAVPLSSAASGNSIVTTPLSPNPASGILIKENTGTLVLTHPNNSHVGDISINGGGFTVGGAGRLNNGDQAMPVVNNATMTFNSTAAQTISGVISGTGALVKSSTGTLTLTAANTYTGNTTVSAGSLIVSGATAGGNVIVNGSGTLAGNGTLGGITTIQSGGTLAPGNNGIGRLTVNNNVTLQTGSTTRLELNKAANTNDVLQVSGTVTYGGTLTVTNLSGTLTLGSTFTLFNATTRLGTFAATNLPALGTGLAWNFNPTTGVLNVVNGVSTTPTNITYAVGGGGLTLSWPSSHIGWRLEAQTNTLALGLDTNWFTVLGATTTNNITLPVDLNNGSVFFRLTYP
ncbi:MAG: autotransporter-associated beta strand repeat-containing protein, partial [Verrucomicrobiota bacterium]